jgi:hypothetical protein
MGPHMVLSSIGILLSDSSVEIDIVTGFVRMMVASTLALTLLTSASTSLRKFVRLAAAPFFGLTRLTAPGVSPDKHVWDLMGQLQRFD